MVLDHVGGELDVRVVELLAAGVGPRRGCGVVVGAAARGEDRRGREHGDEHGGGRDEVCGAWTSPTNGLTVPRLEGTPRSSDRPGSRVDRAAARQRAALSTGARPTGAVLGGSRRRHRRRHGIGRRRVVGRVDGDDPLPRQPGGELHPCRRPGGHVAADRQLDLDRGLVVPDQGEDHPRPGRPTADDARRGPGSSGSARSRSPVSVRRRCSASRRSRSTAAPSGRRRGRRRSPGPGPTRSGARRRGPCRGSR